MKCKAQHLVEFESKTQAGVTDETRSLGPCGGEAVWLFKQIGYAGKRELNVCDQFKQQVTNYDEQHGTPASRGLRYTFDLLRS